MIEILILDKLSKSETESYVELNAIDFYSLQYSTTFNKNKKRGLLSCWSSSHLARCREHD